MSNDKLNLREDFPHYSGHIPYKKNEVIGMTIGATNEYIKSILSKEPIKEQALIPSSHDDYSFYDKDYFNNTFSKDYKLEEDEIFSNRSRLADTWIGSSKYKIYPQHIPGFKGHVPGIISGNIIGSTYGKTTAKAIKGEYVKDYDLNPSEKYKSSNNIDFSKPKMRSNEENEVQEIIDNEKMLIEKQAAEVSAKKQDLKRIFKSKIANVPTPGYSGYSTIFQKKVSYLNMDKILQEEPEKAPYDNIMDSRISENYRNSKLSEYNNQLNLPYISGYKGFRIGVKSGNYHGANFIESSLVARKKYHKN